MALSLYLTVLQLASLLGLQGGSTALAAPLLLGEVHGTVPRTTSSLQHASACMHAWLWPLLMAALVGKQATLAATA